MSAPVIKRLRVVPRERRPMVTVDFTAYLAPTDHKGAVMQRVVITPHSHRAYHVVTQEDAIWIQQVIHEVLHPAVPPTPPKRRSRSSKSAVTTDASVAASNTPTAAASARRHRTRQS